MCRYQKGRSLPFWICLFSSPRRQALEDPKSPLNKMYLGLLASQPPGSLHPDSAKSFHDGTSCNTAPQKSSLLQGFRCSWSYLNFNKGLIEMFSSLKCTEVKFKWWNDRLCVGSIGWVRDITPGWPGELSGDRSCPTWSGLLSLGGTQAANHRPSTGCLHSRRLKAGRRILGEAKEIAPQKHPVH